MKVWFVAAMAFAMAACGGSQVGEATLYYCTIFASIAGPGDGAEVQHYVYEFPDSSVMTTCEVHGGIDMSTGFRLWRAKDAAAETGACGVTFDMDGNSNGYWRFATNAERTKSSVTYIDEDSPMSGRSFDAPCTKH